MSQQARIVATLTSAPEPALLAGLTAADLLEVRADLIGDPLWQPDGGQIDGALELDGVGDVPI